MLKFLTRLPIRTITPVRQMGAALQQDPKNSASYAFRTFVYNQFFYAFRHLISIMNRNRPIANSPIRELPYVL